MFKYDIRFHCVSRYRKHHPDATRREVAEAMEHAREVNPECILPILGRRVRPTTSRYYLVSDYRGVIVREGDVLVTYLRFQHSQQQAALRLWPWNKGEAERIEEPVERVEEPVEREAPGKAEEEKDETPRPSVRRYGRLKRLSNEELREEMVFYTDENDDAKARLEALDNDPDADPEVLRLVTEQRAYWGLWINRACQEVSFRKMEGSWDAPSPKHRYTAVVPKYAPTPNEVCLHPAVDTERAKDALERVEVVGSSFDTSTWVERVELHDPESNTGYIGYLKHPAGRGRFAVVEKSKDDPTWGYETVTSDR